MNSMAASAGRSSSFKRQTQIKISRSILWIELASCLQLRQGGSGLAFEQGCHTQTLASQSQHVGR